MDQREVFREDVISGLSAPNKHLSSKYFYDAFGDELFQQIMYSEDYYLTRKEIEIFETKAQNILKIIGKNPFRLIELGAGDGTKTRILIRYFLKHGIELEYCPVDISQNVLDKLLDSLQLEFPSLKLNILCGDYFDALSKLTGKQYRDVVFFLGSNIGNFENETDVTFLKELNTRLTAGDLLFMGVDLKKDPSVILKAYDDSKNITKIFNLNLLTRINRELDGNFDIDTFEHFPSYNPQTGECRSYLISTKKQKVRVSGYEFNFDKYESIHMETSKKYSVCELIKQAEICGFVSKGMIMDDQEWFADVIWEKK